MPFPWKKAKVTRITRMVADLQSPKRGGSLVVETGFPTSLIDLFVKNRDKLRRSSVKKKKKKHKNKPITDNADPFAGDDPTPVAGDDPTLIAGDNPTPVESEIAPSPEAERQLPTISPPESTAGERRGAVAAVFLAVVRVFAVAALALSTKKLVIGVTLSAFLLLFLEFAGKGLVVWLIRPMKNDVDEDEEDEYVAVRELAESRSSATESSPDEEIFAPDLELLSRDRKWGFLESNCEEREKEKTILVVEKSKSKSKRAIIRRKIIKNFVPKKLRSAKKSKKLNFVEVLEELEEEAREGLESREIFEAKWIGEEEEIEEEEGIELLAVSEDSDGGREENWVVAMMLVVVVLLGLFGGRIFALLLTIVWCFAMKLIGIGIRKRSSS